MGSKNNHFLAFLSFCMIIVAGISIIGGLAVYKYLEPGPLRAEKLVLIKQGMGVKEIADQLQNDKIIHNSIVFAIAAKINQGKEFLKAGEYQFSAKISTHEVLQKLLKGDIFERKITIPEGLTSFQIVGLLNRQENLVGEVIDIPPEGSLLPETYYYSLGETRHGKIEAMQQAMKKILEEAWQKRNPEIPLQTKKEALILASIIEKETSLDHERRKIAGVFINRLRLSMPLQTDPTVIYALTKGKIKNDGMGPLGRRLLRKDLEIDSLYNTYKYAGLPPGAIANPGKASIEAAVNPESHDYIYFVADGQGGHIFSKTLEEHTMNVQKWRQIRAKQ